MAGIFRKIIDALSVDEEIFQPPPRPVKLADTCQSCLHWVEPDKLDAKMLGSGRAAAWAKDNGFGRCTHPAGPANANSDKKRYTKPDSYCTNHVKRTAASTARR